MASASRKSVHLNTVTQMAHAPDGWTRSMEFAEACAAEGQSVHPMFATNRRGTHFALGNTFLFDEMPTFRDTLTRPAAERESLLRDPSVRDRMRAELADPTRSQLRVRLGGGGRRIGRGSGAQWVGGAHRRRARRRPRAGPVRLLRRPVTRRGAAHAVRARRAGRSRPSGGDGDDDPRPVHDGRLERRRRPPAQLLRRRLPDQAADRVGARACSGSRRRWPG